MSVGSSTPVRDVSHRPGDIEREDDAQSVRMFGAVAAFAHLEPLWVHQGVALRLAEDLAARLMGPTGDDGIVGGE